ncbi:phage tail tube protein [Streptomyces malaysiensis subsp. malaysiensis]|uniref:phage tail tube protein n=1 Tax=Streptomyces malaysiensis TaxID=92644 RepID=UPI0024BFD4E1|nr:phage tail tube protein [Streptomyces sp. NA07423]WHX19830.1 phage tail tube protein [Streptomyces sp. NA07423]
MAGLDAFGTQLQRGDGGSPETFTAIANATSITPPALARETLDVTSHGSPDQWREYLGGLKDGGEVSIDINYDPRLHDTLVEDFNDPNPRNYKVVWPGTLGNWAFAAVLTSFEPEAPHDDKLAASLTFQVSGKPTLTPGT